MYRGVYVVVAGVAGIVETPFGWLVLGSAIVDLMLVVVAKRESEIRDIPDTEVKGLSLILGQDWRLVFITPFPALKCPNAEFDSQVVLT